MPSATSLSGLLLSTDFTIELSRVGVITWRVRCERLRQASLRGSGSRWSRPMLIRPVRGPSGQRAVATSFDSRATQPEADRPRIPDRLMRVHRGVVKVCSSSGTSVSKGRPATL